MSKFPILLYAGLSPSDNSHQRFQRFQNTGNVKANNNRIASREEIKSAYVCPIIEAHLIYFSLLPQLLFFQGI